MKCKKCENKIEEIFLGKILGTYLSRGKDKKVICSNCQRKAPVA